MSCALHGFYRFFVVFTLGDFVVSVFLPRFLLVFTMLGRAIFCLCMDGLWCLTPSSSPFFESPPEGQGAQEVVPCSSYQSFLSLLLEQSES